MDRRVTRAVGSMFYRPTEHMIKDVWASNLKDEFRKIQGVIRRYKYVAMDTEFPGVVVRPVGDFRSTSEYQYQLLRCNVNTLKIIQIGFTFMDENGNTPSPVSTWQFNFKFNLKEDMYAQDSIDLLEKCGIQFKKHETEGIDISLFGELISSGILSHRVFWLSFHGGFDFGYLLKIFIQRPLPEKEEEFFALVKSYFYYIYDVKYLTKSCKNLKGGLQDVAKQLKISRVGHQHQAGSDSLLTGKAFFKIREMFFEGIIDDAKYSGQLFGFGASYVQTGTRYNRNSFMSHSHSSSTRTLLGGNSLNDRSLCSQVSALR